MTSDINRDNKIAGRRKICLWKTRHLSKGQYSPLSCPALPLVDAMGYESLDSGMMRRLNLYLSYLNKLPQDVITVTPGQMSDALLLDLQLVRQDMKSLLGKDRVNEESCNSLYAAIVRCTEVRKLKGVVLVGVGNLGSALISYAGFSVFDLDILVGFDVNEKVIKKGAYGKPVYPLDKLDEVCRRLNAKIGVITTPGGCAQTVCDALVKCGVTAIWNFTAARLKAPPHVLIYNEDMSVSLRRLAEHAATH